MISFWREFRKEIALQNPSTPSLTRQYRGIGSNNSVRREEKRGYAIGGGRSTIGSYLLITYSWKDIICAFCAAHSGEVSTGRGCMKY